jgi:Na+/proline symporter
MVHSLGLLGIDPQGASRVGHVIMLLLDSSVLVGLLGRRTWGYWLALGLFVQQTVFQTYWAYAAAARDARLWEAQLATPLVCLACLVVLLARRDLYRVEEPGARSTV